MSQYKLKKKGKWWVILNGSEIITKFRSENRARTELYCLILGWT